MERKCFHARSSSKGSTFALTTSFFSRLLSLKSTIYSIKYLMYCISVVMLSAICLNNSMFPAYSSHMSAIQITFEIVWKKRLIDRLYLTIRDNQIQQLITENQTLCNLYQLDGFAFGPEQQASTVLVKRYTCLKQDDKFSITLSLLEFRKNSIAFNRCSSNAMFRVGWCSVFLNTNNDDKTKT